MKAICLPRQGLIKPPVFFTKEEELETHTTPLPAYLYTTIQRIAVEVDSITLAEYFIVADLGPGAARWDSTTIAERSSSKILYLVVKTDLSV